jgi:hypothetical protein
LVVEPNERQGHRDDTPRTSHRERELSVLARLAADRNERVRAAAVRAIARCYKYEPELYASVLEQARHDDIRAVRRAAHVTAHRIATEL